MSPTSKGMAYANGRFINIDEAAVPLLDWGFIRSDATYDVVSVWKGRFFRLEDHLDRFEASVRGLRMTLPVSRDNLKRILAKCVVGGGLNEAYVSMTCTRGVPPPSSRDPRVFSNRLYAFAIPYVRVFDSHTQGRGANVVTVRNHRIPPESVNPRIKNYHWLDLIMGTIEALDSGGDLPLLLSHEGEVTEGAGYNIFLCKDGQVVTPDQGILEGITRQTVFDICQMNNIPVVSRKISLEEVQGADEVFLTSTAGGIIPAETIDFIPLIAECPGSLTKTIMRDYWKLHENPDWTVEVKSLLS